MSTLPTVFDPMAGTDLNWQPEMVVAIAQGLENPEDIARRFGIEGPKWDRVCASKAFTNAVATKRAELEAEGWVTVAKARLGTEMMVDELLRLGAASDTSTMQKLAIAEYLTKVAGGFAPPKGSNEKQGPGFTIQINLDRADGHAAVKRMVTIEADQ